MDFSAYVLIIFTGYAAGRVGHVCGGHTKSPHHWIYGLILITVGLAFYEHYFGPAVFFFGAGLFVSDFEDFLHLRILEPDKEGEKKFWGVD